MKGSRKRKSGFFSLLSKAASIVSLMLLVAGLVGGQEVEEPGASDPVRLGADSAATTIEVFVDFQCPSCATIYPRFKALELKYPNTVGIIFRHFPLTKIHDKAMIAAQAVEAARLQGRGPGMVDLILRNQHHWANSSKTRTFRAYAKDLGLDIVKYHQDFESEETKRRIESDILRSRFFNINAVPTVIFNGRLLTFAEAADIEKLVLEGN